MTQLISKANAISDYYRWPKTNSTSTADPTRGIKTVDGSASLTLDAHCQTCRITFLTVVDCISDDSNSRNATPTVSNASQSKPSVYRLMPIEQIYSVNAVPECFKVPLNSLLNRTQVAVANDERQYTTSSKQHSTSRLSDPTNWRFNPSHRTNFDNDNPKPIQVMMTDIGVFRVIPVNAIDDGVGFEIEVMLHEDRTVLRTNQDFTFITLFANEEVQIAEPQLYPILQPPPFARNPVTNQT